MVTMRFDDTVAVMQMLTLAMLKGTSKVKGY
jgi:hypothetical protein